ncbi:MAG: putative molybdenum carrier protein [Elusimicrobia bacterium]|nr:putative molybdenum carrier protein [Elusimicrobiota bacterium]
MSPVQIKKVVSGGQTGVDRAALDVALELGIPCGGWCPKGRLAEDGVIPEKYPLKETPLSDYAQRTEWNVRDSDGTLVLVIGRPSGGTALTIALARKHRKPCIAFDLRNPKPDLRTVMSWIAFHKIRVLNVAGPRKSSAPQIERMAKDVLLCLLSV